LDGFANEYFINGKELANIKIVLDVLNEIWAFAEEWNEFMKSRGVL